jgi:hypothetical protein
MISCAVTNVSGMDWAGFAKLLNMPAEYPDESRLGIGHPADVP